jgi:hypothetical protein
MAIETRNETKVFKARGKVKADPKTATITYSTALDLNGALELSNGNEVTLLKYFNSGLEDATNKAKYDELFGNDIKRNALVRDLVALGIPESVAFEHAEKLMAEGAAAKA